MRQAIGKGCATLQTETVKACVDMISSESAFRNRTLMLQICHIKGGAVKLQICLFDDLDEQVLPVIEK